MPIAYSYTRFSSEKQAKGDSLRRQTMLAEAYIREHPELCLQLSPMSLSDEGMSAYKGANARRGALAAFMRAVEDDEVKSGSYLLIENFDRLSRQDPLTSIGQLTDLTKAGINVVTLVDEKIYSTETMKGVDGAWMLMSSIMTMARAHEESATKGRRVKAAWDNKKSRISDGIQLTKKVPFWMNSDRKLKKDKVKLVNEIFNWHKIGYGGTKVCKLLNERGEQTPSGKGLWQQSTIRKLVTGKAVLGILQTSNEEFPGYFKQIVTDELWLSANAMLGCGRKLIGTKRERSLQGLFRCYCGASMRVQSRTGRIKKDGNRNTWTYVVCSRAAVGGDCVFKSIPYEQVHKAAISLAPEIRSIYAEGDSNLERILQGEKFLKEAQAWYDLCAREYRAKKTIAARDAFYDADETLEGVKHELKWDRQEAHRQIPAFIDTTEWWRTSVKHIQIDPIKIELFCELHNGKSTKKIQISLNIN